VGQLTCLAELDPQAKRHLPLGQFHPVTDQPHLPRARPSLKSWLGAKGHPRGGLGVPIDEPVENTRAAPAPTNSAAQFCAPPLGMAASPGGPPPKLPLPPPKMAPVEPNRLAFWSETDLGPGVGLT